MSHKIEELKHEITEIMDGIASAWLKVDELRRLEENWDYYGAQPISETAIINLLRLMKLFPKLTKWQVSPGVNGDIYMNYKGENVLSGGIILLPNNKCICYAEGENEICRVGEFKFSPKQVKKMMIDMERGRLVK